MTKMTRFCTQWLLWMMILLLCPIPATRAATYKVAAAYLTDAESTSAYSIYTTGLLAPAALQPNTAVSYSVSQTSVSRSSGYSVFSYFSTQSAVAMFGQAGMYLMYYVYSNANINNVKLVSFAPLGQSVNNPAQPCFLTFLPQVYWTMASGQVEAVAMLMALANRDRFFINQILLRINQDVEGVGFSAKILMPNVVPTLGGKFNEQESASVSQQWINNIISSKYGVYYLYPIGEFHPLGVFWMQALSTDSNVRQLNATIAVAFELQYLMLDTYKSQAAAGNTMLPPENILSTAPVPGVDSTEYVASQTFVTEASSRFPTGVSKCLLNYMMAGWVGGWALMDALSMFSGSTYGNGQQFYSNMLGAQSSFVVADMFVGSFGGAACSASAKSQGCIPQCHHGGNNVFFFTFTKSGTTYDTRQIAGEYFQYALGMCANVIAPGDRNTPLMDYSLQLYLPNPIHAVGFSASDNSMIALVCNDYQDVITRLHNSTLYWHHSFHRFTGVCINTVSTAAPGAITTFQSTYVMNTLMGVLPDSVVTTLSTSSRFVVDVFPQTTQPRLVHSNLIYLFPTLEQDLHVLASFLRESTPSSSKVCAVVGSSTVSSSIATLLSTTLKSVEIDVSASAVVTGTSGSLTSSIPAGCDYAFLVGLATKDVALISTYLGAHSTTTILITFDDLTKYYSNFATTFTSANAVTDRLLFATNIPSWTATTYDSSAANAQVPLSTVGQFLQSVPPYLHTPAAVRAFLTAMVVDFISANPSPAYPTMSGALYGNGTVSVGDVVFGPFSQTCGSSKAATCVLNFGARDISVWSYTRVLLPETPLKFDPTTPNAFNVLGSGTQSNIVDGGQGAVEADADEPLDCVMLHDSSISSEHHSTSQHQGNSKSSKPAPTESHAPDRSLKDSTSSDQQNSSSDSNVLDSVLYCLVALVCVVAVLLLALWLYGQCGLCYCRRATTCIPRARITKARHWHEDAALRAQASTPLTSMQQLTAVVVDVDGFQALWNRAPVEMSQFMRNYHAVVRRAIIRHHCSEAGQIGGYYAVACESPSTALALAYEVESQIGSAITTELRAALPQDPRGLTEGVLPSPLRIGVHTMTNTSVNDPELFCIAHRTAYVARRGHTMATDAVCNSIETSPDALQLVPVGRHPVLETSNEEMLKIFEHSELEVPAPSKQTDSACWRSALMVERQRECQSMDVNTLCKNYLQSLNRGCSTNTLMVTLECLCQHFGLVVERAPSLPDEEYLSLLAEAVSQRLGAMMEYRHALSFNSSPAVPDSSESVGTVLEALAHSMPTTKDSALMTITRESRKSKRFHRSTTMALRVVHNSSVPQSRMSQGGFSTEDSAPVE